MPQRRTMAARTRHSIDDRQTGLLAFFDRGSVSRMTRSIVSVARLPLVAMGVAWLFVVVLAYYFYHRPIDLILFGDLIKVLLSYAALDGSRFSNIVPAVASTMGDIVVVVLLLALSGAIGRRLLRVCKFESALEALGIQTGFGLGILGFVGFVAAIVGMAQPFVFWVMLIAGLVIMNRDVLVLARTLRSVQLPRAARVERLLALYVASNLAIAFVFALTPPTGWDALAYHLSLPKAILSTGHFPPPSENLTFQYPALVEMLFLFAMGLKSDAAAQSLHWAYFVLTIGLMLAFAARYFSRRVGWLAVALLVGVPSILLLSTYAYNDLALMFYVFGSVYWTVRAIETKQKRDLLLAGALAGMAMGEKYTAIILPVALAALVSFQSGLPTRRSLSNGLVLGLVALTAALPWFLKNAFVVGNPVYPFVFGGLYWDPFRAAWFSRFGTGVLNTPLSLIAVPWTIVVEGIQGGAFDATLGPLILALLPFSLLRTNSAPSRVTRTLAFVAVVLFGFWLVGAAQSKLLWQTRFLFPAFPFFALLAAEGWDRLSQLDLPQFSAQHFATLLIALVLGLNLVSNLLVMVRNRQFDVLLGIETRQEFLARNLGAHYTFAQWINANLPERARVVSLWEPRAYYLERQTEPDAILDRFAHLQFLYADADAIAKHWQSEGFTHVLLYREGLNGMLQSGYDPVGDKEVKTLQALEEKHLHLLYRTAPLDLTQIGGRPALGNAETEPYAVYELK